MGVNKTLLAAVIASMAGGAPSLTFGVTLSNVVGGQPSSGTGIVTINPVAASNIIVPVITASRTTGVAPLAITFDALATTAPLLTALPFSEIHYAWRFGDDRGTYWTYGVNPGGNNKNEAYGPVTAHVFETSGTYTVELVASHINNAGQLIESSTTYPNIVVTNADTVFAGASTICISQNSLPVAGVDGAPAGCAVQQVADWSTVATLAQTYKRILLKRGDTWSVTAGVALDQVSRTGEGIIGTYGTGAKPTLNLTYDGSILRTSAVCDDWRFVDLKLTCDGIGRKENGRSFTLLGSTDLLLLRCEASGAYFDIMSSDNIGLYIVDSVLGPVETWVSGYGGYCVYNSNSQCLHIMGTAWAGGTNHGVRLQGVKKGSIAYNTGGGNIPGNARGAVFTLRGWTPWGVTDWTENVYVGHNVFAGNDNNIATINCAPQNNTSSEALRKVILDGNYVTSTISNVMTCEVTTEFTVRNNIFFSGYGGVDVRGQNTSGTPLPTQNFWYNNTFYSASVEGSLTVFYMYGTVSGIAFTNNIAYAPNITSTTFTNGTGGQVTLTNNSSNSQIKNDRPWAAVTPVDPVDFTPSGSYAVDGGVWVPVYKNYFGATNSAPREIGAI